MRHLLVALSLLPLLASPPHRDWAASPAVVQIDTSGDIFAMGDVHADYERLVQLLAGARILAGIPATPASPTWAAGSSVLVFTGDLIDKGPRALDVIALVRALQPAAAAAGGRVVVLAGNHEAEFLASPDAAKSREFAAELTKAGMRPGEVAACAGDLGAFLCSLPFAVRVNDWFFSHAGNTDGRTLAHIAADLQKDVDRHGFGAQQLIGPTSLLEARIGGKKADGRAWYEAGVPRVSADRLLAGYADALQSHHIVQGHQHADAHFPDGASRRAGELFQWRGLLFLIDTGMSREIGDSAGAILHIRTAKQNAAAVCADGRETSIWDARQPRQTAAAKPCKPRG